jgi:protein-S-isoprenylcysteine O-methyltransferase Ste14
VQALDLPPLWTAFFMVLTWAASRLWAPLSAEWAFIGWLVIALSLALSGWAAATMIRRSTAVMPRRTADVLVTTGPFAYSRNPIYLADLGILFGWSLATETPLGFLFLWPLQRVLTRRFVEPEEARLAERFGEAFASYRESVRRWA